MTEADRTFRILLVSSRQSFSDGTLEFLDSLGYEVFIQEDIKEALPILMSQPFDFIVLEIPNTRSKEFNAFKILKKSLQTKIGILSGELDRKFQKSLSQFAPDFVHELPISRNMLAILLQKHLKAAPIPRQKKLPKVEAKVLQSKGQEMHPSPSILKIHPQGTNEKAVAQVIPTPAVQRGMTREGLKIVGGTTELQNEVWNEKKLKDFLKNWIDSPNEIDNRVWA